MEADRRAIVVSPRARELRRRLGATAWVVLEELLSASQVEAGVWHSSATVRSLASDLTLSKDTIARALARLSAERIVASEQGRAPGGTFAAGHYRITVPDGIALAQSETPTPAITRPRAARPTGSQLALTLD